MQFKEDKTNDFYDREYSPEEDPNQKKKAPKPPRYTPDDPRYWESEESEWEHLRPKRSRKIILWSVISLLIIIICSISYIHFFRPLSEGGVTYGYVENIQKRGQVFKTFEGTLLPYRQLMDARRVYDKDFVFTAANPSVAADIKRMEALHAPVKLEYVEYNTTLPWRGDSKIVVTSVSPVDPNILLPSDLQPEYIPSGKKPVQPNPQPENN